MVRRCKSSLLFGPTPCGGVKRSNTEKFNSGHILKHFSMKLCIYNQHWGTHEICDEFLDLTPGSCPKTWGLGVTGVKTRKKTSKFDVDSFLVELFAIFQLFFRWGFAMARLRLRSSCVGVSVMC